MADQILQVNSCSLQDVEISASLRAGLGIIVDFTQASTVTGSFSGEGNELTNVSASYIVPNQNTTASWAISASWAPMPLVSNSSSWASASISASYADEALSASWAPMPTISNSSSWASSSISASYADEALSASWSPNQGATTLVTASTYQITASQAVSASWAPDIESSASFTASYLMPGATLYVVSGSNGITQAFIEPYDYNPIETSYRPQYKEGRLFYDARYIDWCYYPHTSSGEAYWRFHLGKEVTIGVHNPYSTTLPRLSAVYISGSTGTAAYRPDVYKAIADGTGVNSDVVGVIRNDIPSGSDGFMIMKGVMHRTDVSTYGPVGTPLWLDPYTPGALTTTKPGQPNEVIEVGYVSEAGVQGSFICDIRVEPPPANAYAGMTSYPIITDDTSSFEVRVSSGSVNLYKNVTGVGAITQYPLLETTFSIQSSSAASFIVATTNGATASYELINNFNNINGTSTVQVATVYRADFDAHVMESNSEGLALANKLNTRLLETEKFAWESGYTLIDTGSNNFIITSGEVWFGATNLTSSTFDSRLSESVVNPYNEVHWTYHSESQLVIPVQEDGRYNNLYYDDGNNLAPLSNSYYCVNYFFRILGDNPTDEDVFIVIGEHQYADVASAQNDTIPSNIPGVLEDVSLLVGRMIVLSGSTSASAVESAFTTNFGQSLVTSHNSLSGLQGGGGGQFYHMLFQEYADLQGATGTGVFVRKNGATLTNATISGPVSTASFVQIAQTASFVQLAQTAAFVTIAQTASFVQLAQTASFVATASYVVLAQTASYVPTSISSSWSDTSSWAINAINGGTQLNTGSTYPITASWTNNSLTSNAAISASWASQSLSASWAPVPVSASWASQSLSASWSPVPISASWASQSLSASWAPVPVSASWASQSLSASWAPVPVSASWASSSFSATSASFASRSLVATSASWASSSISATSASWASNSFSSTTSSWASSSFSSTSASFASRSLVATSASWASSSVTASYIASIFSRGGTIYDPLGIAGTAATSSNLIVWRAPFNCSVSNVWGYRVTGSGATVNARKNGTGTIATSDISLTSADAWISASSITATSFVVGDKLEIMLISSSGYPTQIAVQIDFTK